MQNKGLLFSLLVGLFLLQSCGINSNLMFRTPKGVQEVKDSIPLKPVAEYKISRDDKFTFMLYTNEGERIVNEMAGMNKEAIAKAEIEYVVRPDGTADLPILGATKVSGLTVNLSVIEGLKYADMIVQDNDYIYIEPKEQVGQESLKVIAPIVSLVSSALVIITVFSTLK